MPDTLYFRIRNWERYQSNDRSSRRGKRADGPRRWIKLYPRLLDDQDFLELTERMRFCWIGLLLMADSVSNQFRFDPRLIRNRLQMRSNPDLQKLVDTGLIEVFLPEKDRHRVEVEESRVTEGTDVPSGEASPSPVQKDSVEKKLTPQQILVDGVLQLYPKAKPGHVAAVLGRAGWSEAFVETFLAAARERYPHKGFDYGAKAAASWFKEGAVPPAPGSSGRRAQAPINEDWLDQLPGGGDEGGDS